MALPRTTRLAAIVIVVAGIGLSACSSDDDGGSASTTSTTAVTGTTAPGATSTTASTAPAGSVAAFTFMGGHVSGDSRVTVKLGEQVTIRVVSDVAEEVHVHTYDRKVELEPGVPGEVTFTADIPGVHEVELEDSALHLTSLEVQ
ncbi:MAG: hypothetical protein QOG82_2570 [Actinomycetota bacterium]|jgi:hypothetical protein|nr:hypothetical protein [Actinomycetota bacterium]